MLLRKSAVQSPYTKRLFCTNFCAVNESGDKCATSGCSCHACGACARSGIGRLESRSRLAVGFKWLTRAATRIQTTLHTRH